MLPFGVTVPVTVPQRSEIPEGLMNYPVLNCAIPLVLEVVDFNVSFMFSLSGAFVLIFSYRHLVVLRITFQL